jgi:uncharacterized RDD family membrane protein YckC
MFKQKNRRYDSSLTALTPEGVEFILSPAGLTVRTLAYSIDKIIQWVILLIIFIPVELLRNNMGIWLILIFILCMDWFYHVIFELAFHGQSPGKRLTGIRVIRSSGSPVDPASSFIRNLLRFADTFFFLFPVAFLTITASRGFRRLGDWAGGTLVVYTSIARNYPRTALKMLLSKYEPIDPPVVLSYDEKQAIISFARRYLLLGEARANEIAGIFTQYLRNDDSKLTNTAFLLGIARKLSGEI